MLDGTDLFKLFALNDTPYAMLALCFYMTAENDTIYTIRHFSMACNKGVAHNLKAPLPAQSLPTIFLEWGDHDCPLGIAQATRACVRAAQILRS